MPEGFLLLNSRLSSNDVKEIRAALKAAYQRGREDERNEHRVQGEGQVPFAACGDGERNA